MRRITSANLTSQTQKTIGLFSGLYHSLFINFSGTAKDVVSVLPDALKAIRVTYRGQDIVNADAQFFILLNRLKSATSLNNSSNEGGTFNFNILVPFYSYTNKNNSLPVTANDNVQLTLDWVNDNISDGTVTVYGIHTNVPFGYFARYMRQDLNAALGVNREEFKRTNIESVYLTHTHNELQTNITNIQQIKNSNLLVDASPTDLLQNQLTRNQKDSIANFGGVGAMTNVGILELPYTGMNTIQETMGNRFEILYSLSAALNLRQYIVSIEFDSNVREESQKIIRQ